MSTTTVGRKLGMPRRLVLAELQRHARNARFSPHTTPAGVSPQEAADATGLDLKLTRATLHNMHGAGQIVNAGTHNKPLWRLTTDADRAPTSSTPAKAPTGRYSGTELRAFTTRPGAMDAFTLPSLVNGQPVPAHRPSAQLVGALVDRTNNARG